MHHAWFIDLRLKLFIGLLPSRVNDLLKLSERYRIGQLFWPILSTIGLSDFHTIVLTLVMKPVDGWKCICGPRWELRTLTQALQLDLGEGGMAKEEWKIQISMEGRGTEGMEKKLATCW